MSDFLAALFILIGAGFTFIGGLGITRMPDLLLRMHATSKAGSLGAGLIAVGAAFYFTEASVVVRAISILGFVVLTAPVAAHIIGRAGYFKGVKLWDRTVKDDLKDKLDVRGHMLYSGLESDEDDRTGKEP